MRGDYASDHSQNKGMFPTSNSVKDILVETHENGVRLCTCFTVIPVL